MNMNGVSTSHEPVNLVQDSGNRATLGLGIVGHGAGHARFERLAELGRCAEEVGFEAVWTSELYSRSSTIPMAVLAQATRHCSIASGITYGVGRSPLILVAEARDLDDLSEGRLILGLGNGTARMMEDWHGVSGEAPAVRMEELVDLMRKLWNLHEGAVQHEGRFYRVNIRPTSDVAAPLRARLPIYIAGINDRMIEAVGRVGDGLCGHPMFTARYLEEVVRPNLERGARKRDRDPRDIAVAGQLICAVDPDIDRAREELAFSIAQYAASRIYVRLFELHGWASDREAIAHAVRSGDRAAMVAAVSEEMLEAIGVYCRPEDLSEAVAPHRTDANHLILCPPPWGVSTDRQDEIIQMIMDSIDIT